MLHLINCQEDLDKMVAESAGGVLTFQITGAGYGEDILTATGDSLAADLLNARSFYIGYAIFALEGTVPCVTCGAPYTVETKYPAVLLVYPAIPRPTLCHARGICTTCAAMAPGELNRAIIEAHQAMFPGLRALPITAETGHA